MSTSAFAGPTYNMNMDKVFKYRNENMCNTWRRDDKYYGLIVVNKLDNVKFDFYSKLGLSPLECYLSIVELDDRKIIYWKLRKVQVQRVLFNKNEWEEYYKPKIIDFWDTVANYVDTDNDEFRSDSD